MDVDGATLGATLVALLGGVGWALVSRLKRAKRIFPRARFRVQFSLRTPETDPPPAGELEPDLPVVVVNDDERPTIPPPKRRSDDA